MTTTTTRKMFNAYNAYPYLPTVIRNDISQFNCSSCDLFATKASVCACRKASLYITVYRVLVHCMYTCIYLRFYFKSSISLTPAFAIDVFFYRRFLHLRSFETFVSTIYARLFVANFVQCGNRVGKRE